jgi:hypothetical protein
MEMKQLTEYPEYTAMFDAVQRARLRLQQIGDRRTEIHMDLLSRKVKPEDDTEWDQFRGGGAAVTYGLTNESELREELQHLDNEEIFVERALRQGEQKLDAFVGSLSARICNDWLRPRQLKRIKQKLEAIKTILDLNQDEENDRHELQQGGIRDDSTPNAIFDLGGKWDDPYGGKIVSYRKWIEENYPELLLVVKKSA